jgi:hypothetical protein
MEPGLGCDGVIHLLLQRLDRDQDSASWGSSKRPASRRAVLLALVTQADGKIAWRFGMVDSSDISIGETELRQFLEKCAMNGRPGVTNTSVAARICGPAGGHHIRADARVTVGAGPDAVPMARACASWAGGRGGGPPACLRQAERFRGLHGPADAPGTPGAGAGPGHPGRGGHHEPPPENAAFISPRCAT